MARGLTLKIFVLAFLPLALIGCEEHTALQSPLPVTIAGHVFKLELAANEATRKEGLSDRKDLAADGGMLFVFPEAEVRQFWMIRCDFPIDVIFLDGGGRVVSTAEMPVEPPETRDAPTNTYSSHWAAQFAIELKGHTLDTLQLKNGDRIELPLAPLKAAAR